MICFFFLPVNRPKPLPGIRIRLPTASFYSRGATPPPAALRGFGASGFFYAWLFMYIYLGVRANCSTPGININIIYTCHVPCFYI